MIGDLGACLSSNYIFYLKIYYNNLFYFLKFIFYIMISKNLKTQKKKSFFFKSPKKSLQSWNNIKFRTTDLSCVFGEARH